MKRLFSCAAEMRALRAVDLAEMTMVSSFYVGKYKISGSYIHCRFLQSHFSVIIKKAVGYLLIKKIGSRVKKFLT